MVGEYMVVKTAREIIKNARYLAGIRNSEITDFYTNCLLLNNIYSELYIDMIKNADTYINYVDVKDGDKLPDDCYQVMAVYRKMPVDSLIEIEPMPKNQRLGGSYYRIENDYIYFGEKTSLGQFVVKYSSAPLTLTAPDTMKELPISTSATIGKMNNEGFYYQLGNVNYFYNFNTEESEKANSFVANDTSYTYNEDTVTLENNTLKVNGETWIEDVDSFVYSYPYFFVNLTDGHILIYTGTSDDSTKWNYYCTRGKDTIGKILSTYTNEETGKGVIYYDTEEDKLFYASFVPDTVLSYPDNTFFTLMEYKLASILCSLNGQDNTYLDNNLIPSAEIKFFSTIRKDSYRPYRMENVLISRYV